MWGFNVIHAAVTFRENAKQFPLALKTTLDAKANAAEFHADAYEFSEFSYQLVTMAAHF